MVRSIPSIDFRLATSASESERQRFVREVGDALKDIGFFALTHHGIPRSLIDDTYAQCDAFFDLDEDIKRLTYNPTSAIRGATRPLAWSTPRTTRLRT